MHGSVSNDDNTDASNSMLVAVRLRPINQHEERQGHRKCCRVIGNQTIVIERLGQPQHHLKSQQRSEREYAFDLAFSEEATQNEIYQRTVRDIIPTILNGFDATIFAYGATGAGKTHTMMGSERDGVLVSSESSEEMEDLQSQDLMLSVDGIIPQALADIFQSIQNRQAEEKNLRLQSATTFEWEVLISYLEVYNEQIRDLLKPSDTPLALREDTAKGVVHVAGLHYEYAHSAEEVLSYLRRGNRFRKTEPTAANQVSSRSHAIIQVLVRHKRIELVPPRAQPGEAITEGKLSLIDLAGSERASATKNRGLRLTEGANINKSLLALANCINSLSSSHSKTRFSRSRESIASKKAFSPVIRTPRRKAHYRDSKLTHLLKNSLEGDCRLIMIANINPSHKCYEETHNTLKYANRAKNIKIQPRKHVVTAEMTYQQQIARLEAENAALRKALAVSQEIQQQNQFAVSNSKVVAPPMSPRKRRYSAFVQDIPASKPLMLQISPTTVDAVALLKAACALPKEALKLDQVPSIQPDVVDLEGEKAASVAPKIGTSIQRSAWLKDTRKPTIKTCASKTSGSDSSSIPRLSRASPSSGAAINRSIPMTSTSKEPQLESHLSLDTSAAAPNTPKFSDSTRPLWNQSSCLRVPSPNFRLDPPTRVLNIQHKNPASRKSHLPSPTSFRVKSQVPAL
uniref:Kinesin-like protein n=1 Tax=Albugo laibachii Nc14 TaxID=890382 RepID=F0WV75_9STRA|nr:kinesin putative [Albugo laibachii Nc14]|eukprot:CCA25314.1 kinesin putative [Albugo laibachii Nc14]